MSGVLGFLRGPRSRPKPARGDPRDRDHGKSVASYLHIYEIDSGRLSPLLLLRGFLLVAISWIKPIMDITKLLCFACICSSVVATASSGRGSSILLPFGLSRASASSKSTTAKTPAISITTENGGLSPVLTWSMSGAIASSLGRYQYDIGIDMEPLRSENLNAATNVFGRLSTTLDRNVVDQVRAESEAEGLRFEERRVDILSRLLERKSKWDLTVRGNVNVQNLPSVDTIDLECEANCEERGIGMKSFATIHQNQVGASPQNQLELRRLEISKRYGRVTFNPRFSPAHTGARGYADAFDCFCTIERPNDTSIQLYASPREQWLTISRKVGENLVVAPSISTAAAPRIAFRHNVGDASSVVKFSPQERLNVEWRNGACNVQVSAPIKNNRFEQVNVSVKKKIEFL